MPGCSPSSMRSPAACSTNRPPHTELTAVAPGVVRLAPAVWPLRFLRWLLARCWLVAARRHFARCGRLRPCLLALLRARLDALRLRLRPPLDGLRLRRADRLLRLRG